MPTAAEPYNFAEVEKDGKNYISEWLKQCKVHAVTDAKKEKMVNLGTKDVLATHLPYYMKSWRHLISAILKTSHYLSVP